MKLESPIFSYNI